MKNILLLILLLSISFARAQNLIPNADFRNGTAGFTVWGKAEAVPETARSAQGDLLLQEGGIDWILNWRAAEPGMYKFSVRFRNADIAGGIGLTATVYDRHGFAAEIKAVPEAVGYDVICSAQIPLAPDIVRLKLWCHKGNGRPVGIDRFTLEPLPEYRCEAAPPTPDLTRLDAVEEPFQVQLKFRKYDKNSRGAVIERAEGDGPFVEIARLGAYLHSAVDPATAAGTRYRYRIKNLSHGSESAYSNILEVVTPEWTRSAGNKTYYLDSRNGCDTNSGESPAQAWKSLERAGQSIFAPGDRLLFARGGVWSGSLELRGAAVKPLRSSSELTEKAPGRASMRTLPSRYGCGTRATGRSRRWR